MDWGGLDGTLAEADSWQGFDHIGKTSASNGKASEDLARTDTIQSKLLLPEPKTPSWLFLRS